VGGMRRELGGGRNELGKVTELVRILSECGG